MDEHVPLISSSQNSSPDSSQSNLSTKEKTTLSNVLIASCICCSFTGASLGFDVGIMSHAIKYISVEWNLSFVDLELCIGMLSFIAAFGTLVALNTADYLGRRWTVAISSLCLVAGAIMQALSANYAELLFGRIVAGIGVGICFVVAPMYISEISPPGEPFILFFFISLLF